MDEMARVQEDPERLERQFLRHQGVEVAARSAEAQPREPFRHHLEIRSGERGRVIARRGGKVVGRLGDPTRAAGVAAPR